MSNLKVVLFMVVCLGLTACSESGQDINVNNEYSEAIQSIEGEIKKMKDSLNDIKDPNYQKEIKGRIDLQEKLVEDLKQKAANGK